MSLLFRLCAEEDMALADIPFTAAYSSPTSKKDILHRYWELQPDGWWLAFLDGKPVGFGGAIDYGAFSYVGMVAVHPSVQRRGIGEALMRQILAWGEARGCPTMVLDASEQAVSLYKRLGFMEEYAVPRFIQYGRVPLPTATVERLQASHIAELARFDAASFGADRARVFSWFLEDFPNRAFVTRNAASQITGYIIAQKGILGPWVANTPEDAERLLVHALSLSFTPSPNVIIPSINDNGQQVLQRYNFQQQGKEYHMRRGVPLHHRQLAMIYGQASSALG